MRLKYAMSSEIKALGILSTVVAEIHGVTIESEHPELNEIKNQAFARVMNMDDEFVLENPVLQSYRDLVKKVGRSAKKFPPAAESFIQLIRHSGRFPHINTAVDSYNVVVTKKFLALGVHDIDKLSGEITFRLSDGQEPFTSVGGEKIKYTQRGDFVYADKNQVLAWLDSKDSDLVKLALDTKNILIVIQGTHCTPQDYNLEAAEEACQLITRFCGGSYEIQKVK